MWIKKINDFFDNMSEYDNNSLSLHFAVDLIDILKGRVKFTIDDNCNVNIVVLPYEDTKEETEIDDLEHSDYNLSDSEVFLPPQRMIILFSNFLFILFFKNYFLNFFYKILFCWKRIFFDFVLYYLIILQNIINFIT